LLIVVVGGIVGVVAVLTVWLLMKPEAAPPAAVGPGLTIAATTTLAEPGSVVLTAFTSDPPVLTHPTVLPDGWTMCSVTEDRFQPDRFCGGSDDQWFEVKYAVPRPSNPEAAIPAGIHNGEWLSETGTMELRFPINEHVAAAILAKGLEADQVLEIADSIPIVGGGDSLFGPYELPIDWESMTGDDLVDLLDQFEADAAVDLGRFELEVLTSNASLRGFSSRGYWTADAATDLPLARLVPADRPLVIGESTERRKGFAVWDQAGFGWRLEGNLTADDVTALALSVIAKLNDFPKITDR
jgi:hypothetical protein